MRLRGSLALTVRAEHTGPARAVSISPIAPSEMLSRAPPGIRSPPRLPTRACSLADFGVEYPSIAERQIDAAHRRLVRAGPPGLR